MKRVIKLGITVAAAAVLCISAAGCGLLKEAVIRNREGKEQCAVNQKDASSFYMGNAEYTILEDTVAREQLGGLPVSRGWTGITGRFIVFLV